HPGRPACVHRPSPAADLPGDPRLRRSPGAGPMSSVPPRVTHASLVRAAADTVLIGTGAGLVTGALHAVVILVLRFGFGRLVWHSRDVIWMAPLANAVI